MGKYFGTDGIRGVANSELTCELVFRAGLAAAQELCGESGRPLFLIARDTRISGELLESALSAGIMAGGGDVCSLGVLPTPAAAFLAVRQGAAAAAVISASHNPYEHNGIKFFSGTGYKLTDEQEARIEARIDAPLPAPERLQGGAVGRVLPGAAALADAYVEHVQAAAPRRLDGLRLLLDCANGASSATAARIFTGLGADCTVVSAAPDGCNINRGCGSTHIEALREQVVQGGYDLALAFDGDADRCLALDAHGDLVDGDRILAILANDLRRRGQLRGGCVATVLSNLGFFEYLRTQGIESAASGVGDRYVLELMQQRGFSIGGEQSGHLILLDHATTGDGELTGMFLCAAVLDSGRPLHELAAQVPIYPQLSRNVPVPNDRKKSVAQTEPVQAAVRAIEAQLGARGRVIIRPSGTEPLVRVMLEGPDPAELEALAQVAVSAIESARGE